MARGSLCEEKPVAAPTVDNATAKLGLPQDTAEKSSHAEARSTVTHLGKDKSHCRAVVGQWKKSHGHQGQQKEGKKVIQTLEQRFLSSLCRRSWWCRNSLQPVKIPTLQQASPAVHERPHCSLWRIITLQQVGVRRALNKAAAHRKPTLKAGVGSLQEVQPMSDPGCSYLFLNDCNPQEGKVRGKRIGTDKLCWTDHSLPGPHLFESLSMERKSKNWE